MTEFTLFDHKRFKDTLRGFKTKAIVRKVKSIKINGYNMLVEWTRTAV
jgi:hypothetical protein